MQFRQSTKPLDDFADRRRQPLQPALMRNPGRWRLNRNRISLPLTLWSRIECADHVGRFVVTVIRPSMINCSSRDPMPAWANTLCNLGFQPAAPAPVSAAGAALLSSHQTDLKPHHQSVFRLLQTLLLSPTAALVAHQYQTQPPSQPQPQQVHQRPNSILTQRYRVHWFRYRQYLRRWGSVKKNNSSALD
jgi:hypothetical protein